MTNEEISAQTRRNFWVRLCISLVAVPIIWFCITRDIFGWLLGLIIVTQFFLILELAALMRFSLFDRIFAVSVVVIHSTLALQFSPAFICISFALAFGLGLFTHRSDPALSIRRCMELIFSILYVSLLALLPWVKSEPNGNLWICFLLSMVWSRDILIYLVWLALGGHVNYPDRMGFKGILVRWFTYWPVNPEISSNKQWTPVALGFLAIFLSGFFFRPYLFPEMGWIKLIGISSVFAGLCHVGDLSESMLKRAYSAKDSGRFFPGHGGILDRLDTLLFLMPFFYFYVLKIR